MVDGLSPGGTIPASVPDDAVPTEKVETQTTTRQKARRANRFLKGPVPLSWIRDHVRDPAGRLLLVLRAHADIQRKNEIQLTADILRDAGIADRKVAYRAMKRLEAGGSIAVRRKRGRRALVCLKGGLG
ncbi:MAG: hypothetical protein P8M79_02440 [Alphaproteobacteria bacterium]|nr:hypothetical protein [Alphaproteobacteria bacterium]